MISGFGGFEDLDETISTWNILAKQLLLYLAGNEKTTIIIVIKLNHLALTAITFYWFPPQLISGEIF